MVDLNFYKDKIVLVTGHTGFKGTWLSKVLINAGAKVIGYSLKPLTEPNLFSLAKIEDKMISIIGDIRDYDCLKGVFDKYNPEIVIHLAAQPILKKSYEDPKYTYDTNVMGTINICECVRNSSSVKSFLNVTSDKVYHNEDSNKVFEENDNLNGDDPYSNSKTCSEIITCTYRRAFFKDRDCSISTARACNVIGGGDFSPYRIIPDCIRAIEKEEPINLRNPYSVRPYQHVLEALNAYLIICEKQYLNKEYEGSFNVGSDKCDCITTGELADKLCKAWGNGITWINNYKGEPFKEAKFLSVDNSKIKEVFNWKQKWHIDETINKIVEWTKVYLENKNNVSDEMDRQIKEFFN